MSKTNKKARLFSSTGRDRLELTVNSGGYSVVQESRNLKLSTGTNHVQLEGMPAQYKPASLLVLNVTGEGEFTLGPVSYKAASLNGQRLLAESIGSEVTVRCNTRKGRAREITGKLLAFSGNQVILERDKKVVVVNATDEQEFPGLPKGLSNSPALVLEAQAGASGEYLARLLYQTAGLAWNATHTAVYDEQQGLLTKLESWVSVNNGSGAQYRDATLKLLSGDTNGAALEAAGGGAFALSAAAAPMARSAKVRQAQSQSVGEQKLYTVPGKINLAEGENKQIPLFIAEQVPVTREYCLPAMPAWQRGQQGTSPVVIRLRLLNNEDSKLGKPLPAGLVNIFQPDTDGSLQLTGTAQMADTAVGEELSLVIAGCSDLKAERKLVESKTVEPQHKPVPQLGDAGTKSSVQEPAEEDEEPAFVDETWEVTLHNFKPDRDVEIVVKEEFPGKYEVLHSTHEFKAETANRASTTVKVDKAGKAILRYVVRYQQA